MTRRLQPLPREASRYDPAALRARQAELVDRRKNTAVVYRKHTLAVAHRIRQEIKQGKSS